MSEVEDFSAAAAVLRNLSEPAADVLAGAERQIGEAVADNVRARARRHRKSGQMERRISVRVSGTGIRQEVRVHAGGKVAHLVIGGTRPHRIVAPGRPIPFGGRQFAQSVRHPGTRPDPFFAAGMADSTADIATALDDAGADLVRGLARRIEGGR
jgi:hypothetical protein